MLQQAMRHEMAERFFNEPVDAVALGIPDYHEVIKVGGLHMRVKLNSAVVGRLAQSCIFWQMCNAFVTQLCQLSIREHAAKHETWEGELLSCR